MSVLAKDRKESPLRVMTHWMDVRVAFNRLFIFDFGYDEKILISKIRNEYHVYEPTDRMKPERLDLFKRVIEMNKKYVLKYFEDTEKTMMQNFREVEDHIYIANTIYPTTNEELSLRRCHQEEALGICYAMLKELEFIVKVMPVKVDKYPRYIELLNQELSLLKAWRASNNKFNVQGKSSRRQRRKQNIAMPEGSAHTPSDDAPAGLPDSPNTTGSSPQATVSANATTPYYANNNGVAAGGSRYGHSKGRSFSTGYRQPPR